MTECFIRRGEAIGKQRHRGNAMCHYEETRNVKDLWPPLEAGGRQERICPRVSEEAERQLLTCHLGTGSDFLLFSATQGETLCYRRPRKRTPEFPEISSASHHFGIDAGTAITSGNEHICLMSPGALFCCI